MRYEFRIGQTKGRELNKEARALKVLVREPAISIRMLAKRLNFTRNTISRWKKDRVFSAALGLLKENPKLLEHDVEELLKDLYHFSDSGIQYPLKMVRAARKRHAAHA